MHVNQKATDFELQDENDKSFRLNSLASSWVVLYFYPQDDTPGCTVEACSLRDAHDEISDLGAHVIGVSKDPVSSHAAFKAKHNLNFTLLSDPDRHVIQAYGAWGKKMFGREGVLRKTFIINPDGIIVKVFGRVTPVGHGDQVVAELKRLQAERTNASKSA